MANKTLDLDFQIPGRDNKSKKKISKRFSKIFLIVSACVLVAAIAVAAILLMGNTPTVVRIIDFNTAINGVSVGGINITGMTRDQAVEATAQLETNMLAAAKVSLDVNGQIYEFQATDISITTDYTDIINQAMAYGHNGTFDEREAAAKTPKNFDIKLMADEAAIGAALANLKSVLDTAPKDASVIFAPWGYEANPDGTFIPYKLDVPKLIEMCKAYANKKEYPRPDLVRIPENEMPLAVRYEYWKQGKGLVENYRPADANISRFIYTPEVTGLVADTAAVVDDIMAQVESGSFTTITVPVEVSQPAVKLADIKANTQMIASWTSYWGGSNHENYNRNYNVAMISSLINDGGILQPGSGSILQPGVEWSVNKNVGDRDKEPGRSKYQWKKAAGIKEGGFTDQLGGGVCQLGSTTFNAIIRAGASITIIKQKHHTIPSDYIPIGLDATLSSGNTLDLIVRNDNTLPYYLVSYIDPIEKTATVEIYGPPVVVKDHPEWGNVIYKYTSVKKSTYGEPVSVPVYCNFIDTETDDGVMVTAANPYHKYADIRKGVRVQTYMHIYSLDGTPLWEGEFQPLYSYPVINGKEYFWGTESDPFGTATPTDPPVLPTSTTSPLWFW